MGELKNLLQFYRDFFLKLFKLYYSIFVDILPFIFLLIICQAFLDKFFDYSRFELGLIFFFHLGSSFSVTLLFFCFNISIVYQKYYFHFFKYRTAIRSGLKGFIPVWIASFIVFLPLLLLASGIILLKVFNFTYILSYPLVLLAVSVFFLFYLAFSIYFYLSGLMIVNEQKGILDALVDSFKLIRGHWFKVVPLFIVPWLLIVLLQWLLTLFIENTISALAIIRLFSVPFWLCLQVVLYDYLKTAAPKTTLLQ